MIEYLTRRHKRALIHLLRGGHRRPLHMPRGVGLGTVTDLLRWNYIAKIRIRLPIGFLAQYGYGSPETRVKLTKIGQLVAELAEQQIIDV